MTNQEKAQMYDAIVREGDELNRQKSRLKALDTGLGLSKQHENEIVEIDKRLILLERRLNELLR